MVLFGFIGFLVALDIIIGIGISVFDRFYRPHIFFIPEQKAFLYKQAKQKVIFDYLALYDGSRAFPGAKSLFVGEYSKFNDSGTYILLDRNGKLNAVLPYHERYGDNKKYEVALVLPDNKKAKWMSTADFMDIQVAVLNGKYNQ